MSEPTETAPANPSNPAALLLEDVFFAPLVHALQTPGITRNCATVDDASFVALAVLRVLENSKTGRDFIQTHGIPTTPGLTRSNYFDSLASPRRLKMLTALERELQRQQLPLLRAHDDRLAHFSELDEMEIWAADGHHIAHATHDPRNEKDTYRSVNAIYKLDLRSGWMRFMDLARPTARGTEHEIHHPQTPRQARPSLRSRQRPLHPLRLRLRDHRLPIRLQPQTKQKHLHPHRLERQPRPHDRHAAPDRPRQPRQRARHQR